jgi:KEOPS complex subunit Pcc1
MLFVHVGNFRFRFEDYEKAKIIYAALKPEEGKGVRSNAKIYLKGDGLLLRLEAEDLTSFRASLNAWLRFIKVCEEVLK